ncbi:hypothetical protein L210DRAFT_532221 [Boletus edulis BED1]|uniref:Uncharacterized protein n=1 Tax=Boletus edulis BED1 TaxID=1328754 RepID=A0AAD4GI78_BOLED|nr:hypothetical protein L210DRAFT_532221 [Boletus edulis BED1]
MLTSGYAPPLPEDWCMRGMEYVGRKVCKRGYWKKIVARNTQEGDQLTDGIIQDEDADERGNELKNDTARRWIRITRTAVNLAGLVDGFTWVGAAVRDTNSCTAENHELYYLNHPLFSK